MKYIKRFFLILTIVFLVAFPKGGLKIGEIPLTWGYILLIISIPFGIISLINNKKIYIKQPRRISLLLSLPFIIYSSIILMFGSYESLGYLFSFILSILLMPFIFLIVFNKIIEIKAFHTLLNTMILYSIRFVTVFGLILFLQRIFIGSNWEIPYLTVNVDDIGHIDEKYNLRGAVMKYTSTYNNGNIYGICMLIFTPLYTEIEKSKILKIVFFTSLALTLSRTTWIGMLLYFFYIIRKNIKSSKGWVILILTVLGLIIFIPLLLNFMNLKTDFLFDKNLGGRAEQLDVLNSITFFGTGKFDVITEIVYLSILRIFGVVGLIFFLLYLSSSLIAYKLYEKKYNLSSDIYWGVLTYMILCGSDGAILFIPTMAFFWFISSYMLSSKNDGLQENLKSKFFIQNPVLYKS